MNTRLTRVRRILAMPLSVIALACAALGAGAAWQHLVSGEVAEAHAFVEIGQRALAGGDRGAAVLAFERAEALAPRDAFVRSIRKTADVGDPGPALTRVLRLVTSREWLAIASASAWGSGIALAILILRKRRPGKGAPGWVALSAGGVCVLATAALVEPRAYPRAVVIGADVRVRVAPYATAAAESSLASGAIVVTGPEFGAFRKVRTSDGATGWIAGRSLESVALPGA